MFLSVPTLLRIMSVLLLGVGLSMAVDIVEPETTPIEDEYNAMYQTTDELESATTPAPPSSDHNTAVTTAAMQMIHPHTPAPNRANDVDTAAVAQHSSGVAHGSRNLGTHVRGRTVFITFVPGALLVFCIFAACFGLFLNAV